jgi:hypothetical protein
MTEITTVMVPVEIDKACACLSGRMRPTGAALMSNPPKYPHVCNRCGHKETFRVKYPHITHKPAEW